MNKEPTHLPVVVRLDGFTVYNDKPPWCGGFYTDDDGRAVLNGKRVSDSEAARGWTLGSRYKQPGFLPNDPGENG